MCDENNVIEVLENTVGISNVVAIEYVGDKNSPCYCCLPYDIIKNNYVITIYEVENLTDDIVKQIVGKTPQGVTPVIKLDKQFSDLEKVWKLNKLYPRVRFCGGHLFCIDGCNIGCCGMDILDKKGISYDMDAYYRVTPCNCALTVCSLSDLNSINVVKDKDIVSQIETKESIEIQPVLFSDLLGDL